MPRASLTRSGLLPPCSLWRFTRPASISRHLYRFIPKMMIFVFSNSCAPPSPSLYSSHSNLGKLEGVSAPDARAKTRCWALGPPPHIRFPKRGRGPPDSPISTSSRAAAVVAVMFWPQGWRGVPAASSGDVIPGHLIAALIQARCEPASRPSLRPPSLGCHSQLTPWSQQAWIQPQQIQDNGGQTALQL